MQSNEWEVGNRGENIGPLGTEETRGWDQHRALHQQRQTMNIGELNSYIHRYIGAYVEHLYQLRVLENFFSQVTIGT